MELRDYPRPPQDTGIGVHWSPANSGSVGAGELREKWIPQLQRMGVKWVKLMHEGGVPFAGLLLEAGIMPIVRLYRHRPNSRDLRKAVLGPKEIAYLKDYVAVGVRYFEFNNEPELASEWEGGEIPPDAIDYVARAAIIDMETILGLGGYPAVPATAIGTKWDLIGKIVEHGGDYLFDEPVWLALHNYDINHPLDYPYDAVNRRGELLTPEDYRAMGTDAWTGARWGTRTLAFINERRVEDKNPRADIMEDASAFLSFRRLAELSMKHLGRYLPILSTEGGPIVGEDDDPRYPTTTPEAHAAKVAEIARIMMGVSRRYDAAPDYYFCTAFWLMGAAVLRTLGWEGHAWFSPRWPDGHLPAVEALEQLPKQPRRFSFDDDENPVIPPGSRASRSVVSGVIHGYPDMRVILRSAGFATDSYTDDRGSFRFENLPAGDYRLSVPGAGIVRLGIKLDGTNHVVVEIGEPEAAPVAPPTRHESAWRVLVEDGGEAPGLSVIRVSVEGKVGLPVHISAEGWEGYTRETGSKPEYGPYALEFSPLGPGAYLIEPEGLGADVEVRLSSSQILNVIFYPADQDEMTPPGDLPAESKVTGTITNGRGIRVLLKGPYGLERLAVADKSEAFIFDELPAGVYQLRVPDLDFEQALHLSGSNQVTMSLEAPDVDPPTYSTISGRVMNGAGRTIMLRGPEGERLTEIGPDDRYLFDRLGPGKYYVRVKDTLLRRSGLKMTGRNHRRVNFAMPMLTPSESVLYGQVPGAAGWQLYVRGPNDIEIVQPLDEEGRFEITGLQAGEYHLVLQSPQGAEYTADVTVDGLEKAEVTFGTLATSAVSWSSHVEDVGPGPGFVLIRVRVSGHSDLPVRLWTDGWTGMVRRTGDKPEFGTDVCEFAPLGQGYYYLQPAGLAEALRVDVPANREIWVTFTLDGSEHDRPSSPSTPSEQKSSIFVLIRTMPSDLSGFIQTLRFAERVHAAFGADIEEAMKYDKVVVMADSRQFSDADMNRLIAAGCEVYRIAPPYSATGLEALIKNGRIP